MHELDDLIDAVGDWAAILDQADELAAIYEQPRAVDPRSEVRKRLPHLLSTLTPEARNLLRGQLGELSCLLGALDEVLDHRPRLRLVGET